MAHPSWKGGQEDRPQDLRDLEACIIALEVRWKIRPVLQLACGGGSDQHWQIFHPDDFIYRSAEYSKMPSAIWTEEKGFEIHPDGRLAHD
jgi:hypothetical protein